MKLSRVFALLVVVGMVLMGVVYWSGNDNISDSAIPKNPDFNFDVRPILSNQCFLCHGPDSSSRQANLRLDTYEGITAELPSGRSAVVPGKPNQSELLRRVMAHDPSQIMPPPETEKKLTEREVDILRNWIKSGAKWDKYWAFIPPKQPAFPTQLNQNPIDYLIDEKLSEKGLIAAKKAGLPSLVRRLSYVLIGLPSEPTLVKWFVESEDPNAYERLVDTLLASPHFGERWARHWMDLVRYADTKGHEFDYPIDGAWRYRDYLIRAFNADVPYDQFLKEHIAGDLIPAPRVNSQGGFNESVMGTAFYCLSEGKHSPVDIKEEEVDRLDNTIDVLSKTFLGITVSCAKCHDHKFDPITATDYYALYGMLESSRFTNFPAQMKVASFEKLQSVKENLDEITRFIEQKAKEVGIARTVNLNEKQDDPAKNIIGDFRNGGLENWHNDGGFFVNTWGFPRQIDGKYQLQFGHLSSRVLGKGLQGAIRSPNFTIEKDSLVVQAAGEKSMIRIIIDNFQLIQYPIYGGLHHTFNDVNSSAYYFDLSMWKGHKAYVEVLNGAYDMVKRHAYHIDPEAWIEVDYVFAFDQKMEISDLLKQNNPEHSMTRISDQIGSQPTVWSTLISKSNQIRAEGHALQQELFDSTFLVGVTDGDRVESKVFIRGNHNQRSEQAIPHRYFTALAETPTPFERTSSGRLEFAQLLATPDHPLTSRVMVNRIWHHLFGRGIVATVDNFGLQGKIPSNPALLDYLAIKFVEDGWSVKSLIRHIVLSDAFQRSIEPVKENGALDPDNIYLSHYSVRRLEAEIIRDAMLACSGRLDRTLYGPSIPIYLTDFLKGRGRPPMSGPIDGEGRRSIYQQINRNFLPPFMMTFDMPTPFTTFGKRNVSNVPAQSLTLMNDPFVAEMAKNWAEKIMNSDLSIEDRIHGIYWKAFSRQATEDEMTSAKNFLGGSPNTSTWADFCHVIFNTKAFIYLT